MVGPQRGTSSTSGAWGRVAAGVVVLLLAACAPDETGAVAWDHAVLRADGRTIDAEVGMTPEGDGPCEVRYDQRVVERPERVTVAFVPRPKPWWRRIPLGGCAGEGVPQHRTVRLAEPLGDREVYDGAQREPRPVHREVDLVEVTVLPPGFRRLTRVERRAGRAAVHP